MNSRARYCIARVLTKVVKVVKVVKMANKSIVKVANISCKSW